jgi:hypothetical protein
MRRGRPSSAGNGAPAVVYRIRPLSASHFWIICAI